MTRPLIRAPANDSTWRLRDLEAVAARAQSVGFSVPTVTEMPANNLSVVFRCLTLQLHISFDVRFPSDGLMRTSPD
jgi:hypothetical protein